MYRTTPEGRILLANPALVEMLGFDSFEELAVRKLERDETYVDRSRAEFKRMVEEQGEIRGLESAWRRRDGTVVHVRESARVMRGEAGKVLYYEGTVEDITERRTAEAALRESEARFRDLVEHSHELMTTMTLDGTILTVNRAAQQALGLPRERLVGANIRDFLVPRYRDAYQEYVATIRERGEAAGLLRVMTARGEERLWEYRNTVRTESVAEPIVRGLARDVSEEWRARRRLEESEERYRDLVEKAGVAIVVDDVEGRLTYSNRRFAELLGYTEAEIRNIAIERLVHPDDCERVMSTHRAHVSGRDAPWSYRFRGVHRDGRTLHLAVDVTPLIRGDRLAGTRSYIRDETEERLLQEQLLQAQKMETVGRLAGGVAHDFNNVLQVILAHAGVALTDLEKGIATEDHLREIRAAAERAAGLTRQLLAFSRRQEIKPEILDLNELANGMRKMLRRVISEDIEIVVRPEPGLLLLEGDRGGLEQVLLNLAVNARDAMPGGGLLTISTGATAGGDDDGGGQVWLAVADTGCGMDEATRDKIFEPFFTTKDRERGTGLGLATVYGIVRRHGGTIRVESEPGRGSTFTIVFPAAAGPVPAAQQAAPEEARGGAETVLVAEDDPAVREVLVGALEGAGYTVLVAEDGVGAVELFTARSAEIEMALLDAIMPHMDGIQALAAMRAIRPDLPALFSTGYSGTALGQSRPLPEDADVIVKPYTIGQLLSSVRRVLDNRTS